MYVPVVQRAIRVDIRQVLAGYAAEYHGIEVEILIGDQIRKERDPVRIEKFPVEETTMDPCQTVIQILRRPVRMDLIEPPADQYLRML